MDSGSQTLSISRTEKGTWVSESTTTKKGGGKRGGHSRNMSRHLNTTSSSVINPMKSPEATDLFSRYKHATSKPFCPRKASIKDLYELHRTLSKDLTRTKQLIKKSNDSVNEQRTAMRLL